MVLAILAHCVLLAMLSVGVQWKREPLQQTFEAELWASVPVEAAPPAPDPEPPKPTAPEVKPAPEPKPRPEPKPLPPQPTAATLKAQADIALFKEKENRLKEKKLAQEKLEFEKQKLAELEKKKQAELEKKKLAELDKQKLAKLAELEKQKLAKLAELEKQKQAELDKQAKLEQDKKAKLASEKNQSKLDQSKLDQSKLDQKEARALAEQRQKAIKRMESLAGVGGSGSPDSNATAAQSSGPSASYAGKIVARIKPNITYPDNVSGNPRTEVEIRTGPSGAILSARIIQSSGLKSWDDAVLRAIDKTETLPRDTNGTVQPLLVIGFRPKD